MPHSRQLAKFGNKITQHSSLNENIYVAEVNLKHRLYAGDLQIVVRPFACGEGRLETASSVREPLDRQAYVT